jgi:hypothetical protein
VGFDNPSYPQNYPQKIRVSFDALAPNVNIIVTEGLYKGGGFANYLIQLTTIISLRV